MAQPRSRIVALVIGCLLLLPALGALAAGAALGIASTQRDADGYFEVTLDPVSTPTVAVTAQDLRFGTDPGSPDWIDDWFDADVRMRVSGIGADTETFVGIGRSADVDRYLAGTAHTRVVELTSGARPVYRDQPGDAEIAAPTSQDFWAAEAVGTDTLQLDWQARSGRWSVVVMNADGSPGVAAEVEVGLRVGPLVTLVVVLLIGGVALTALAVVLIVVGAWRPGGSATAAAPTPLPPPLPSSPPSSPPSSESATEPSSSTSDLQEVHR